MISTSIPFDSAIKLSFFDKDGKKIEGISINQAIKVWEKNNKTLFYFKTGDGTEQELTIDEVKKLPNKNKAKLLPSRSECDTGPVPCGPPMVRFFGGGGFGAAANAIVSPISSSVIGLDIVNAGKGYKTPPNAEIIDSCGKGSGGFLIVNLEPDSGIGTTSGAIIQPVIPRGIGTDSKNHYVEPQTFKIKNVTVVAPGDGYLSVFDGSLGGNERIWKEPDEGYVKTADERYYVVQPYRPIQVRAGSTYYDPNGISRVLEEDEIITLSLTPVKRQDQNTKGSNVILNQDETFILPTRPLTPTGITPTGITPRENQNIMGTTYPVLLCIEEIQVLDSGFGYRPGDELIITPDNGTKTELLINDFGQITGVKLLTGGCGYNDFPDIRTNSPTGFNATFTPIFKATKIEEVDPEGPFFVPDGASVIEVVDCVGKILPKREFDIVPR